MYLKFDHNSSYLTDAGHFERFHKNYFPLQSEDKVDEILLNGKNKVLKYFICREIFKKSYLLTHLNKFIKFIFTIVRDSS